MSKVRNKLKQLSKALTIIEMYNSHYIMGAEEDILHLKNNIKNFDIIPTERVEEELKHCIKMVEAYYNDIPSDFVKQYNKYIEDLDKEMF